ncbi:MAG: tetratricopeptide repeat protein [Chlamydiales bacterium]
MSSSTIEKEIHVEFDKDFYRNKIHNFIVPTIDQFEKKLRSYAFFNLSFIVLIFVELIYFFVHLTFLLQTFVLAIHLALIFATIFSYFTLRLYFQTYKREKLMKLCNEFVDACRSELNELEGEPEYYCLTGQACCQLASELHSKEYGIYRAPFWLKSVESLLEKFSCWCHWMDVHMMKEMCLQACVEEHILFVRIAPTDLEAHAGLANAYVMLSGLYVDPRSIEGLDDDRWIPPQKYNEEFRSKFRLIAERAIEEFKILSDYAPNDPWVHIQLAYSYHDLQMPQKEIKEYETVLQLCPEDKETLYKLGKLYFEQGHNAKGLQVYETLTKSNYKKAEDLIHFYGAYSNITIKPALLAEKT